MHASLRLQNETFTQSLEYENEILQSNTFTNILVVNWALMNTVCSKPLHPHSFHLFSEPQHSSSNGLVQRTSMKLSQKQKK